MLAGAARDLRDIPLDERGIDELRQAVYAATRDIPPGTTRSYGEVARAIGRLDHEGARDVGAALARNPFPIIVPCHRVVAANGALTRLLGAGRPRDEAPDARARGRAGLRPAGPLRLTQGAVSPRVIQPERPILAVGSPGLAAHREVLVGSGEQEILRLLDR